MVEADEIQKGLVVEPVEPIIRTKDVEELKTTNQENLNNSSEVNSNGLNVANSSQSESSTWSARNVLAVPPVRPVVQGFVDDEYARVRICVYFICLFSNSNSSLFLELKLTNLIFYGSSLERELIILRYQYQQYHHVNPFHFNQIFYLNKIIDHHSFNNHNNIIIINYKDLHQHYHISNQYRNNHSNNRHKYNQCLYQLFQA